MVDATDVRVLEMLQQNARVTNAEIARQLHMAPSAILQRIRRLEERGVIQGYSARVDPDSVARGLVAYVFLVTDEPLGEPRAARAVAELPEVLELHDIAGDDCYLAKVRVADTSALHRLLREKIATIPDVRSTRTVIVLKTFKESLELPLPAAVRASDS